MSTQPIHHPTADTLTRADAATRPGQVDTSSRRERRRSDMRGRRVQPRRVADAENNTAPEPGQGWPTEREPLPEIPRFLAARTVKIWLVFADLVSICIGVGLAFAVQSRFDSVKAATTETQRLLAFAAIPILLGTASMSSMYTARANSRFQDELRNIGRTVVLGVGAVVALAFALRLEDVSRFWAGAVLGSVGVMLTLERRIARRVFRGLRRSGRMSRRILLLGIDDDALGLCRKIRERKDLGYHAVGFVRVGEGGESEYCGIPVLGHLDRVEDLAAEHGASGVIISLHSVSPEAVNSVVRRLTNAGLHVTLSTGLQDIDAHRLRTQQIGGRSMIYIEPTIRTGWRRLAKRAFDVAVAVVGLIVTAPIVALAALAIRIESSGPILFRQQRVGLDGKTFRMIKLRTMVVGAEALKGELLAQNESDGPLFKMRDDPRITRVGRFLRKTSIDELPQFWNVLHHDMSVVGPRPALPKEVAEWPSDVHERLRVLPGITGMWQVSGRASATFSEYKRLDLYYVDNWSLVHDLRIVCKTFLAVVNGRGAS